MTGRPSKPWWSAADDAELDLLVHELVDGYFDHRDRCAEPPCEHVGEAIEAVLDWLHVRNLRSRAVCLRAQQDVLDALRLMA